MLREKAVHPVLCGSLTPPQERNNSRTSRNPVDPQSPGPWFEAHSIRNFLQAQERGPKNNNITTAEQQGFPQPPQGSLDWKNTAPRNATFSHCELITDV